MIISYLKSFAYALLVLLVSVFLMSILSYFNIIGPSFISILELIIPIVSLFIGGFFVGTTSKNKGYLEGIKFGILFIIILALFNYLGLRSNFNLNDLLFYLILIISSMLGSMIGINKRKSE